MASLANRVGVVHLSDGINYDRLNNSGGFLVIPNWSAYAFDLYSYDLIVKKIEKTGYEPTMLQVMAEYNEIIDENMISKKHMKFQYPFLFGQSCIRAIYGSEDPTAHRSPFSLYQDTSTMSYSGLHELDGKECGVMFAYHGTSYERARIIMTDGFIASTGGAQGPGVYMSRIKSTAHSYSRRYGGKGTILELVVMVGRVLVAPGQVNGDHFDTLEMTGGGQHCVKDPKRIMVIGYTDNEK